MINKKNIFKTIIFFLISLIFIFILYKGNYLDLNLLKSSIDENLNYIIFASIAYIVSYLVSICRFKLILEKINIKLKFKDLLSLFSISVFFGQLLPGNAIFIESIKIVLLSKNYKKVDWEKFSYSVIIDKCIGLSSFFFISCFFLIIEFYFKGITNINPYALFGFLAFAIIILNSFRIFNFFTNKIKNLKYSIGIELLYGIFGSFFLVISYYLVFCAVEFNGTISEIGIVIPFIILSFLIPVGMAGIGGYQFIAIFIFSFIMDNSSIIASGSLIFSMLLLIINGFLGIYFINQNVAIITKLFKK